MGCVCGPRPTARATTPNNAASPNHKVVIIQTLRAGGPADQANDRKLGPGSDRSRSRAAALETGGHLRRAATGRHSADGDT